MQNQAEKMAQQLLDEFGYGPPTDLERILQANGLVVRHQDLEDAVSGMLLVRGDRGAISVNSRHHPNRQRFTLAHEAGHYFLHRSNSKVFIDAFYRDDASSRGDELQEIQANAFAAELLMPETVVRELLGNEPVSQFDERTVMHLAASFKVSVHAMIIRLTSLNLVT